MDRQRTPEHPAHPVKTDIFYFHAYTELFLENKWVKATPAFDISICRAAGVNPLEFDGRNDSLFQQFDLKGNRYMEYINDRGQYADVPFDEMVAVFTEKYSVMFTDDTAEKTDFEKDIASEHA